METIIYILFCNDLFLTKFILVVQVDKYTCPHIQSEI